MDKTVCKTYFSITGEFDVADVSDILKLQCTGGHDIGEKKKYGIGVYDWAGWEYGTDYIETLSADEQAEFVIAPLLQKVDELLNIKEKFKCRFILMQVPTVENGNTPSLGYSKKIIDFCAKTDTEIRIDLYVNSYISEMDSQ